MTKNIIIMIIICLLLLSTFLLFIKVNLDYKKIEQIKEAQLKKEVGYLDNLSNLTAGYNEIQNEYENLLKSYSELKDNLIVEEYQTFTITGYSANDPGQGTSNLVKTGFNLDYEHVKKLPIIAVDPNVIPLYSIVEIKGQGIFLALDTGGEIKGNRIDILFDNKEEAIKFGKQAKEVRIVKWPEEE